jgi:hypothetical protein
LAARLKAAQRRRTPKGTKEKRRSHSDRRFETIQCLSEQEFYEDLYLTEQPYGFVSGVVTDLPANDCSSAAFT